MMINEHLVAKLFVNVFVLKFAEKYKNVFLSYVV